MDIPSVINHFLLRNPTTSSRTLLDISSLHYCSAAQQLTISHVNHFASVTISFCYAEAHHRWAFINSSHLLSIFWICSSCSKCRYKSYRHLDIPCQPSHTKPSQPVWSFLVTITRRVSSCFFFLLHPFHPWFWVTHGYMFIPVLL